MSQIKKQMCNKQKQHLIDFMENNSQLAKGFSSTANGKITNRDKWETLTTQLNSFGPPFKSTKEWQKAWTSLKYNAKHKLSENKLNLKQTGGGPYNQHKITLLENIIIKTAGLEPVVDGIKSNSYGAPLSPLINTTTLINTKFDLNDLSQLKENPNKCYDSNINEATAVQKDTEVTPLVTDDDYVPKTKKKKIFTTKDKIKYIDKQLEKLVGIDNQLKIVNQNLEENNRIKRETLDFEKNKWEQQKSLNLKQT